ncbi:unnamed protein product [Soboliphyme baturini]|uniref:Striatin domain-containing protein n=1 Tax=Soboliphyme baturini TaxID=241478 RepID=A0A183ISW1_9BILA|nr:unnamed protein product [Soboliphyme baturini]
MFANGPSATPYQLRREQEEKVIHDTDDFDDVDQAFTRDRLRSALSCPPTISPSFGETGRDFLIRGDAEEFPAKPSAMSSSPIAFEQWIDFKSEAITFRETTAGIISLLQHCMEMIQQHDELWKKKLDRETEKRKRYEESYRHLAAELYKLQTQKSIVVYGGPDYEVCMFYFCPLLAHLTIFHYLFKFNVR